MEKWIIDKYNEGQYKYKSEWDESIAEINLGDEETGERWELTIHEFLFNLKWMFGLSFWGEELVNNIGMRTCNLRALYEQVFVEIDGRLNAIMPGQKKFIINELEKDGFADPLDETTIKRYEYELARMQFKIPLTHKIKRKEIEYFEEMPAYEYHLQQMAVSPDPLQYLEQFKKT